MNDFEVAANLDAQFHKIVFESEKRLGLLDKAARIRLEAWLRKLHEGTPNPTWKKNRNTYAKLMLEMLRRGRLESPYTTQPPNGPLPMLPQWKTYNFMSKKSGTSTSRSPGRSPARAAGAEKGASNPTLRDYIGRPDSASTTGPNRHHAYGGLLHQDVPGNAQGGASGKSPRSSSARGRPGASFTTEMMQRSELEAQLGAMRERCAELEWRLSQADAKMAEQNRELAATKEELSRVRDQKDADTRKMRQTHRRDLEDLIGKVEQRRSDASHRASWDATPVSKPARGGPGCTPWEPPRTESSAEDGAEMRMNKPGVLGEDFNLGYTVSGTNVGDDEGRLESHFRNYGVNLDEYDTATPRGKESQKAVSDQDFLSYLDSFQQQTEKLKRKVAGHG
ncbi:hypothetical protein CYMTET_33224 [Cymbomonas tetramitiformis]|uniref:DUF4485 domain-containing protein n=1 Tax=Cymbomonas tetramitiformis TaxID=36881 RepID=A0AAE0KR42_9CHLO|nr:hypothetical protein CYMTET_36795 [Cymbomonas tetramitiformis]KAK3257701.1 hypothetical protein CYMTET_33224 [Cymbomonas tetramitiformis]